MLVALCTMRILQSRRTIPASAGAAHERPVDIRHSQELRRSFRRYASAVLDPEGIRHRCVVRGLDLLTDEYVNIIRLIRRRCFAGADRPYGLVRDHKPLHLVSRNPFQPAAQLGRDHILRLAALALFRVSPTQTIGINFLLSATRNRLFTVSSVSPKYCLRSLWPIITYLHPNPTAFLRIFRR